MVVNKRISGGTRTHYLYYDILLKDFLRPIYFNTVDVLHT